MLDGRTCISIGHVDGQRITSKAVQRLCGGERRTLERQQRPGTRGKSPLKDIKRIGRTAAASTYLRAGTGVVVVEAAILAPAEAREVIQRGSIQSFATPDCGALGRSK